MAWFTLFDGIKKKVCRYLLQRYLGQFLDEKLQLEQLNIELYNGNATVHNVALNCEALNELCEYHGWSVEVITGHLGSVTVTVPWNALTTDDSSLEVSNLFVCLRPLSRQNDGSSMLESMWSSMSSSMQLAQDCLRKQDEENEDIQLNAQNSAIEGLEKFAQTIDSVLNRIKAKFLNTEIRLEYLLPNSKKGIAVIIKIDKLDYANEAGDDPYESSPKDVHEETDSERPSGKQKTHLLSTYASHHISVEGIKILTEEFQIESYEEKPSKSSENLSPSDVDVSLIQSNQFYSTISKLPETEQYLTSDDSIRTYNKNLQTLCDDQASVSGESDSEEDTEQNLNVYSSESVPIVQINGVQEIRIKMKQVDNISGPKVALDVQLGSIFVFISPRQLYLIAKFYEIFFNEVVPTSAQNHNTEDNDDSATNIMQNSFSTNMTGILGKQSCWSDPTEEINTKAYVPKSNAADIETRNFQYCESINSSMSSSSTTTCSTKYQRKAAQLDSNADISNFNVRVASMVAVILHEDILFESILSNESPLSEESVSKLLELSNIFFSHIDRKALNGFVINRNHLMLNVNPIIAEGTQQRNKSVILMKFTISLTRVDIDEVLENVSIPLLNFDRTEICSDGLHKRPEVTIQFKTTTPTNPKTKSRKAIVPRTDLNIILENSVIELDISMYDRLSAIFSPSPFNEIIDDNLKTDKLDKAKDEFSSARINEPIFELRVDSPKLKLKLRFPISDVRPIHDPNRVPWWKQNVRPDFLLLELSQFRLGYSSLIEILSNEIDIFYCENTNLPKVHIGKSSLVNNGGITSREPHIEYPKISIEIPTEKQMESILKCFAEDSDSSETSGESYGVLRPPKDHLPFSSKRVCRHSDTPHIKNKKEECETVLLPGETIEMNKFCEKTMKKSKLQIKILLPVASFQINSKHLYEIIYNRINTDLLMWEPSSPSFKNVKRPPPAPTINQSLLNIGLMDSMYVPSASSSEPFYRCNNDDDVFGPRVRCSFSGCDNGSDMSDCESESMYYSTHERKRNKRVQSAKVLLKSSTCSFELNITRGLLTLYAPVRDSENRVLPGQLGEFIIKLDLLTLFSVSGFESNENMAYLCLQTKSAELFHSGLIPTNHEINLPLRLANSTLPSHVQATLYHTPPNLTKSQNEESSKRGMLSLAIEIKKVPEQKIKRIKITVGIERATLKHNPSLSQYSWLNQLIDFVDVLDFPIEGYKPFGIVTELQLHLWDCAIDYRPKNFTYRTVIEIGTFMISSNLVSSISGCTLRFIAEDCVLSLAPYDPTIEKPPENEISSPSSTHLVPVIDLGLLDISLRLNEASTELYPKFDLRASIQDMHLRTCADSGRALAQLITYFAVDGDLVNPNEDKESMSSSVSSSIYSDADLLSIKDRKTSVPDISAKQQERVNLLMAEAVQESVYASKNSDDIQEIRCDRGAELFFFPDETKQLNKIQKGENRNTSFKNRERDISPSSDGNETSSTPTNRNSSDEWGFKTRRESESSNELRDILNFETSVMAHSYMDDDAAVEALPQVLEELGEVPCKNQKSNASHSRNSSFGLEDDFCVIADEERVLMTECGIKEVKIIDDPLRIVDNHFTLPIGKPDLLKAPENFPMAVMRYTLCEMTLTWHIYGGFDFTPVKNDSNKDKENIRPKPRVSQMSEAYKHGVSYSKSQHTLQFGKPIDKLSWRTSGGSNRNHDVLIEVQLTKVRFSHELYPSHTTQASRQVLIVSELEIRDRLQISEIKKFLYHPKPKHLPNKSSQHMVVIKALHVRPNPQCSSTKECSLRISLLPLRLNIDQEALLFLVQFFNDIGEDSNLGDDKQPSSSAGSTSYQLQPPVMMVDDVPEAVQDLQARRLVSTNLDLLMEDELSAKSSRGIKELQNVPVPESGDNESPIYFREVVFSPEVLIRLDYQGRRIEMSRGPVAGLLMGLGQLQCSEIRLKKIVYRHGLLGLDKLISYLFKEWLQDIKKNQLPSILSGVGPTYTLLQLFQGIRDLFWLPIEQFQKDGRIIRGLQLGAQSFSARTALAALEITSRIVQLLQFTAETAFDMVSPGPSVRHRRNKRKGKRKRPHRPQDIREGVTNAYQLVKEGINDRASTIYETAVAEHDQKGYTGAVGAMLRQIPPIIVCPVVLATQATSNILGGVKSQLVPDAKLEAREKWKEDSD